MDPITEWEKLNRRVRLAYYIGQKAVDAIDARIRGGSSGGSKTPDQIGIDVDNDGVVDAKYTKAAKK